MGYSPSKRSLLIVQEELKVMLAAKANVEFITEDPRTLAYRLRAAINSSKHFEDTKPVALLASKFIIRLKRDKVICELRVPLSDSLTVYKLAMPEAKTINDVITATIANPEATEIYFSSVRPLHVDLVKLHKWCTDRYFIIIDEETGLTITKRDPGEIKWSPHDTT